MRTTTKIVTAVLVTLAFGSLAACTQQAPVGSKAPAPAPASVSAPPSVDPDAPSRWGEYSTTGDAVRLTLDKPQRQADGTYVLPITVMNMGTATVTHVTNAYYVDGQRLEDVDTTNTPALLLHPGQQTHFTDKFHVPAGTTSVSVAPTVSLQGSGFSAAHSPTWEGSID